ncbi:NADPH:quinone reductase-like Zn-dependent oxidoreductase [Paraburkholderia sp. BL6665CI2N2]|uniref:zinc-dependent alcohol dehydrogenase family protein n=1 Tax=Paraburkholderia sp. BL6665CI2N2 TaxID=1938806 RepID=UPI0010669F4D|nr:NAD(P)-dependent alcohol dehydrogenase [Paraburkholderia sp. BL6665CI2N2]TDY27029.1 NADPH:quinone reductase-like Zn-dependent oxidoreductase [Paraburkholderia sp. BL6665CI2N2]
MKLYRCARIEGITGLEFCEEPDLPPPGPHQVLMKVNASSLNFRELLFMRGALGDWLRPNYIPVSDGAGTVVAVGSGVRRVKPGDRVAATFYENWVGGTLPHHSDTLGRGAIVEGMLRDTVLLGEEELVAIPKHLSDEEAATLPCAALTAWNALCEHGPLLPGQTVVVQGTGGVSLFALQFAKLFGARVIATSSSDAKLARLAELGADATINYRSTPRWADAVLEQTDGNGADLVVEVGGAATFAESVAAARKGGRISVVGMLTGAPSPGDGFFMRGLAIAPIHVGSRQDFETMNRAIDFHRLKPVIDSTFAFADVPDALRHLESQRHFGKIVIQHA